MCAYPYLTCIALFIGYHVRRIFLYCGPPYKATNSDKLKYVGQTNIWSYDSDSWSFSIVIMIEGFQNRAPMMMMVWRLGVRSLIVRRLLTLYSRAG